MPFIIKRHLHFHYFTAEINVDLPAYLVAAESDCAALLKACHPRDEFSWENMEAMAEIYFKVFIKYLVQPIYESQEVKIVTIFHRDLNKLDIGSVVASSNFKNIDVVRLNSMDPDDKKIMKEITIPRLQYNGFSDSHFLIFSPKDRCWPRIAKFAATIFNGDPVVFSYTGEVQLPVFLQLVTDKLHGETNIDNNRIASEIESLCSEYRDYAENKEFSRLRAPCTTDMWLLEEFNEEHLKIVQNMFTELVSEGIIDNKCFVLLARFRNSEKHYMQNQPYYDEHNKTHYERNQFLHPQTNEIFSKCKIPAMYTC